MLKFKNEEVRNINIVKITEQNLADDIAKAIKVFSALRQFMITFLPTGCFIYLIYVPFSLYQRDMSAKYVKTTYSRHNRN